MSIDNPQLQASVDDRARQTRRASWLPRDMLLAGLTAVGLVFAGTMTVVVLALIVSHGDPSAAMASSTALIFALEALLIVPAWWWGPRKYGGGWRALGLRGFPLVRALLLGAAGLLVALLINGLWDIARRALGLAGQPNVLPLFGHGLPGLALALVLGSVVAPIAEEIFFRGFLYAGLRARLGLGWGLVSSAAIFALVHVIPGVLPPIFCMGLLLALLYELTGSLWPAIVMHGAINALGFIALYLAG